MPHMPKSKLTEKDMRSAIRYVREAASNAASIAMSIEREAVKSRAMAYKDLKVKEFVLDAVVTEIDTIKDSGTQDICYIIEKMCNCDMMNRVAWKVSDRIDEFDDNPENANKINSNHISLIKTIERAYMVYMIELLVRAEVETMRNEGINDIEIMNVLNLEQAQDFEERGKILRRKVRAVVRPLFGVPEKEQRIDKLREESRTVMRNVARNIGKKYREEQCQSDTELTVDDSGMNIDNR